MSGLRLVNISAAAAVGALLCWGAGTAQAATMKVTGAPVVTAVPGGWSYEYNLVLDSHSEVTNNAPDQNHIFAMLDIPGLIGVSFVKSPQLIAYENANPGVYTYNPGMEAVTPINSTNLNGFALLGTTLISGTWYQLTADSASLLNAELVYPGNSPIDTTTGSLPLGTFAITSAYGPALGDGIEFSIDHVNPPGVNGADQITITPVQVPVPTPDGLGGLAVAFGLLRGRRFSRRPVRQ